MDLIDLHVHSNASDGSLTPSEVAKEAITMGLKAIALTDHDNILGLDEAQNEADYLGIEKEKVEQLVPKVRTQFAVNTLEYLHMGGRCSGMAKIFGTALKLKPIIRVLDNKMVVAKKPIGYNRGLQALLGYLEQDKDNIDEDNVISVNSRFFIDEVELFTLDDIYSLKIDFNFSYNINELNNISKFSLLRAWFDNDNFVDNAFVQININKTEVKNRIKDGANITLGNIIEHDSLIIK